MTGDAAPRARPPQAPDRLGRFGRQVALAVASVAALLIVTLALPSGEASAHDPEKRPTSLELVLPVAVELGAHPLARIRLTSGGAPVPGQLVSLRLGTKVTKQITTSADGAGTIEIGRDLSAGSYRVTATFASTASLQSSSSQTVVLKVRPVLLTIATVPSTPGLSLVRVGDGNILTTGADGTVRVEVTTVGDVTVRLSLPRDTASLRIRLAQWDDGSIAPTRKIRIPDTLQLAVGLQSSYPVRLEFGGTDDTRIDAGEVSLVRVSDSVGQEVALTGTDPHWLRSNAISRPTSGLVSTPLEYRVTEARLNGADVVNRGQQRFIIDGPLTLQVKLLVFNLVIQGRDALLKTPSGERATITSPDGTERVVKLDRDARATIRLPRGVYRIVLAGGIGTPLSTPVALSRDQTAEVLLVSLLDIGLVAGVGLSVVIGLILVGRPQVLRRRRRGSAGGPEDPGPPLPAWPEPAVGGDRPPSG